jgi:hypothetical protein
MSSIKNSKKRKAVPKCGCADLLVEYNNPILCEVCIDTKHPNKDHRILIYDALSLDPIKRTVIKGMFDMMASTLNILEHLDYEYLGQVEVIVNLKNILDPVSIVPNNKECKTEADTIMAIEKITRKWDKDFEEEEEEEDDEEEAEWGTKSEEEEEVMIV